VYTPSRFSSENAAEGRFGAVLELGDSRNPLTFIGKYYQSSMPRKRILPTLIYQPVDEGGARKFSEPRGVIAVPSGAGVIIRSGSAVASYEPLSLQSPNTLRKLLTSFWTA
jgi:hypothetical protein